jgi:hypothetical protein
MYIAQFLSEEKIDVLVRAFKTEVYKMNEIILREGHIGTRFYIIKSVIL